MYIQQLDVYRLRNLKHVQFSFQPGANLLCGANGSGKTSVLEAIYLLGHGRSFRSRNIRTVITHDLDDCVVFARLVDPQSGRESTIGIERNRKGEVQLKVSGESVQTAAALAEELPIQLLNSDSFNLLEGGPLYRRQFLDWGVFHVEHDYRTAWKAYQRCLKHRNSLLRHGRMERSALLEQLAVWNTEFCRLSEQIDRFRRSYIERFKPVFESVLSELSDLQEISFGYQPGWDIQRSLAEVLEGAVERDLNTKTSNYGAHRADLRIKIAGKMASDVLSRGQIKTVVSALRIAQGYLYREITGKQCIYLLDDLPSELDATHRSRVCELLNRLGAQVFITGVFADDLATAWPENSEKTVFHVEHGQFEQQ